MIWFGPAAAHATNYYPVLSAMDEVPEVLKWGWQGVYNMSTAYWVHRVVLNVAQIKFDYMIEDIRSLQQKMETKSVQLLQDIVANNDINCSEKVLQNAQEAFAEFKELVHYLLYTYADGYLNFWKNGAFHSQSVGYPAWWLEAVGYPNGPPPVEMQSALSKTYYRNYIASLDHSKFDSEVNRWNEANKKQAHIRHEVATEKISSKACVSNCYNKASSSSSASVDSKAIFSACVDQCFQ